jgi:hypothetical protein
MRNANPQKNLKKETRSERFIRNEPSKEELEILNFKLYKKLGNMNKYEKLLDKVNIHPPFKYSGSF